jgi:hypothetical protein
VPITTDVETVDQDGVYNIMMDLGISRHLYYMQLLMLTEADDQLHLVYPVDEYYNNLRPFC